MANLPAIAPVRPVVPVVLTVLMEPAAKGALKTSLPVPGLAAAASSLGHIHVELDDDGHARSVFLLEGLVEADPSKNATWPHFALATLEAGQPKAAGAGLGMVFVKTVTERHGGRVDFDRVPDRDTRFRRLLPAAPG